MLSVVCMLVDPGIDLSIYIIDTYCTIVLRYRCKRKCTAIKVCYYIYISGGYLIDSNYHPLVGT